MLAKLSRLLLTLVLLLGCVLMLPACQVAPRYYVDSYDDLKEAFIDQPDMIFPDISKYEESDLMAYSVELYGKDRSIRDGYAVNYARAKESYLNTGTVFSNLEMSCLNLEHYLSYYKEGEKDSTFDRMVRTTYRGITFYAQEAEEFSYEEDGLLGDEPDDIFPLGTRAGHIVYAFDFNGYRYFLHAQAALLPEEQTHTTYEERMTQAKDELMVLVDDILDKGGAPK